MHPIFQRILRGWFISSLGQKRAGPSLEHITPRYLFIGILCLWKNMKIKREEYFPSVGKISHVIDIERFQPNAFHTAYHVYIIHTHTYTNVRMSIRKQISNKCYSSRSSLARILFIMMQRNLGRNKHWTIFMYANNKKNLVFYSIVTSIVCCNLSYS